MANVITGIINTIQPIEEFPTANGTTLKRRKVVISTVEEYPQSAVLTLRDKLAEECPFQEGSLVSAYLKFRTYSSKDGSALFNEIQCWKLEKGGRL